MTNGTRVLFGFDDAAVDGVDVADDDAIGVDGGICVDAFADSAGIAPISIPVLSAFSEAHPLLFCSTI